jgi:hypothetical protein
MLMLHLEWMFGRGGGRSADDYDIMTVLLRSWENVGIL